MEYLLLLLTYPPIILSLHWMSTSNNISGTHHIMKDKQKIRFKLLCYWLNSDHDYRNSCIGLVVSECAYQDWSGFNLQQWQRLCAHQYSISTHLGSSNGDCRIFWEFLGKAVVYGTVMITNRADFIRTVMTTCQNEEEAGQDKCIFTENDGHRS